MTMQKTIRVKYPFKDDLSFSQAEREGLNQAILDQINTQHTITKSPKGEKQFKRQEIYQLFTGKGKLHGLDFSDFDNFHQYTKAKQTTEIGQFFTPHHLAQTIVSLVNPTGKVLDPCCGAGVFCNFLVEQQFTGVEIDSEVAKVAKLLYPFADIINYDITTWEQEQHYDYIITNPPYNLRWYNNYEAIFSQSFILRKAKDWLNPYGIFIAIVPYNYLLDEFYFKKDITFINEQYTWLGSVELPINAFKKGYGIAFKTKLIAFQNCTSTTAFTPDLVRLDELEKRIKGAKAYRKQHILEAIRESGTNEFAFSASIQLDKAGFDFKIRKYLYEIARHPSIKGNLNRAINLLNEYKHQRKPDWMDWKAWENMRIKKEVVLAKIQGLAKVIPSAKRRKDRIRVPKVDTIETTAFQDIVPLQSDLDFLETFRFQTAKGVFALREKQKADIALMLRKRYGILNWEQGVGKTVASYAICEARAVRLRIILSKPLAIKNTWLPFLQRNKEDYVFIQREKDLDTNRKYWCLCLTTLARSKRLQHQIRKLLRNLSNQVQLILDESDNICNRSSSFYRATRATFIHCRYKLLTTGTTTRNNANELYPQLEFLYNNSLNLLDLNSTVYYEDKDRIIQSTENSNYGKRYHPYFGLSQFAKGFSPAKATVFGIERHDQNVYNYSRLTEILNHCSIVRTLEEMVGEKKEEIKQLKVQLSEAEQRLQRQLLEEFHEICYLYFNSSGNARKEAGLRKIRQLRLLIKSTSIPESFVGHDIPISSKRQFIYDFVMKQLTGKVAIGCTLKDTALLYYQMFADQLFRPIFLITGDKTFKQRRKLCAQFESTVNGILICTQQSLESSVDIPSCNNCIMESLQWNLPTMSQFYRRFTRLVSKEKTNVWFVNYERTIENNLMSLIMAKERINKAIKLDEVEAQEELYDLFGLAWIQEFLKTQYNQSDQKYSVGWGEQAIRH